MSEAKQYLLRAVELAAEGMKRGDGGPFAAVIVRNGEIIGEGWNEIFKRSDPTAHAEVVAIQDACKKEALLELAGATMYCTGEPCPMCMGAIYWSMLDAVYFAATAGESALHGFDDTKLYKELAQPAKARALPCIHFPLDEVKVVYAAWDEQCKNAAP